MKPTFQDLVQALFQLRPIKNAQLAQLEHDRQRIHDYYLPRNVFERWRDSVAGQTWKKQQYESQRGCCAICKKAITLKGSHVDHKKPLSQYPELATVTQNLQIACPECNTAKGARE